MPLSPAKHRQIFMRLPFLPATLTSVNVKLATRLSRPALSRPAFPYTLSRPIGWLALSSATLLCGSAIAQTTSASAVLASNATDICYPSDSIDKEKLATVLLQAHPVSALALMGGSERAPMTSRRELLAWLLAKTPAPTAPVKADSTCSGADADACQVEKIRQDLSGMLNGHVAQYAVAGPQSATAFLSSGNRDGGGVTCTGTPYVVPTVAPAKTIAVATPAAAPAPAAPAATGWRDKLRINGNPDQLNIDKTNTAAFASMDRASVNINNNDVANSRTRNIVAFAGYSLFKSSPNDKNTVFEVVPYVGVKQNTATNYSANSTINTKTTDIGVLSSFNFGRDGSKDSDNFNIRPDYLLDSSDKSRLMTLNFQYIPVRERLLNDVIPLSILPASIKPIMIVQSRTGHYSNRGDGSTTTAKTDFSRLGAQVGFSMLSNNRAIPLDWTTTFTGLRNLRTGPGVHYWKSALTWSLNQNLGLTLGYSNGTLPDSGDPEKQWSLSLGAKY